jgi:hypothetical protein
MTRSKPIRGKDGKFAGSIGHGKTLIPTPSPYSLNIPLDPQPAPSVNLDTALEAFQRLRTQRGAHPVYGGYNWGVEQDTWGDFSINHGYYGSVTIDEASGHAFIDNSNVIIPDTEVRWACDVPDSALAATVWNNRDFITAGLRARGFSVANGVRIRIADNDDKTLQVSPFDYPDQFEPFTFTVRK